MDGVTRALHWADYLVFGVMLMISLGIGVGFSCSGSKRRSTEEYLLGNRNMGVLPVALSFTVSYVSTVVMLGYPAEIYLTGSEIVMQSVGMAVGTLLAVLLFVPVFYPLKFTSITEYLTHRYDSRILRGIGSFLLLANILFYCGNVFYGPSTAVEAVTGVPAWISIIICAVISIGYTSFGGYKAVIWTDTFQAGVMFVGMAVLVGLGTFQVGGFEKVFAINKEWKRLKFIDVRLDESLLRKRSTTLNMILSRLLALMSICGAKQSSYQRYSTMPTMNKAILVVLLVIPGLGLLNTLSYFVGWTAFAYFTQLGCDPFYGQDDLDPQHIVPKFMMEIFVWPGTPGLFLAAITASSLSSASSALNGASAIAMQDIIGPLLNHFTVNISERSRTACAKAFVIVFGIIGLIIGIIMSDIGGTIVQIMLVFGYAVDAPMFSIFFMGILMPFINATCAGVGTLVGATFAFWLGLSSFNINKDKGNLPLNTESCILVTPNTTMVSSTLGGLNVTDVSAISMTTISPVLSHFDNFIQQLHSISFNWYPVLFFLIPLIIAGLISPISLLFKSSRKAWTTVPNSALHPLLRTKKKKIAVLRSDSFENSMHDGKDNFSLRPRSTDALY